MKMNKDCKHKSLFFDTGGMHLVCHTCQQAWAAVDHSRLVFDYAARTIGLTSSDVRTDPLSVIQTVINNGNV